MIPKNIISHCGPSIFPLFDYTDTAQCPATDVLGFFFTMAKNVRAQLLPTRAVPRSGGPCTGACGEAAKRKRYVQSGDAAAQRPHKPISINRGGKIKSRGDGKVTPNITRVTSIPSQLIYFSRGPRSAACATPSLCIPFDEAYAFFKMASSAAEVNIRMTPKKSRKRARASSAKKRQGIKRSRFDVNRNVFTSSFATGPIPNAHMTTLKYVDWGTDTTDAAGSLKTIRSNSIFDPDHAIGGHQPLGRDELAALYDRYRVLGCRVRWSVANRSVYPLVVTFRDEAVIAAGSPAAFGTWAVASEQNNTSTHFIPGNYTSLATGGNIRSWTRKVPIAKVFGITNKALSTDNEYDASMGTNPSSEVLTCCYVHNFDTTAITANTFEISWEVAYKVKVFDKKSLGQS